MVAEIVEVCEVTQRECAPIKSRGSRMGRCAASGGAQSRGGVRGAGKEARVAGYADRSKRPRLRPQGRERETLRTGLWGQMGAHGFSGTHLKG